MESQQDQDNFISDQNLLSSPGVGFSDGMVGRLTFIERILDINPNIVYVYDVVEQRNIYSNGRIAEVLGYSQEEVLRMGPELFLNTIHPEDLQNVLDAQAKLLKANSDQVFEIEYRMLHANGTYRLLHSSDVAFARNLDGTIWQILGVAKDITHLHAKHEAERVRLSNVIAVQQKLASTKIDENSLMDEIVRCAVSTTSADGAAIEQIVGDELVYGATAGELKTLVNFRLPKTGTISGLSLQTGETIISNDCQNDPRTDTATLKRFGIMSLLAVPMRYGDEIIGILKATSSVQNAFNRSHAQTLELIAGFAASTIHRATEFAERKAIVDERFKVLEKLHQSEETFRLAIEAMQESLMIVSAAGKIEIANAACERIFGLAKDQLFDLNARSRDFHIIRPDGWEVAPEDYPARIVFRTGEPVLDIITGLERDDGTTWINTSAYPLAKDDDGTVTSVVIVTSDITKHKLAEQKLNEQMQQIADQGVVMAFQMDELEHANSQLAALATTDGLTELFNHRSFQEQLEVEVSRAERYGMALSVIMLDVDHFKQYNDLFGHPAGDALLKKIGASLKEVARQSDFVARYGGEEFVVILPETTQQGASIIAERFRARIEAISDPFSSISASFGIAVHRPGLIPSDLISTADGAMYESKKSGRNCVTVA